ncbi:glutamate-1-semialdehyde 2,1-aminomutase, partial [Pseudomonas aeruginosa]|nr:glutamate-1-semialdehyde 2,1-aminomutase [Pseudomonas aeruginosa]
KGGDYAIPYENERVVAELLRERYPFMVMVRFSCSGTEGTMHALRVARAYTAKDKIIKLEGGFHGAHDSVLWSIHPDVAQAGPA